MKHLRYGPLQDISNAVINSQLYLQIINKKFNFQLIFLDLCQWKKNFFHFYKDFLCVLYGIIFYKLGSQTIINKQKFYSVLNTSILVLF